MTAPFLISPEFEAFSHIQHGFSTRSLSGGSHVYLHKRDKYAEVKEEMVRNRAVAMSEFGYTETQLSIVRQVHGTAVETVTAPWLLDQTPEADAMVTHHPGRVLGILTADCVPVLFAETKSGIIGAAHAGWKGAKAGVLENTLGAMETLGANRNAIVAIIGACIHQKSYEVGNEFYATFLEESAENSRFFIASERESHYMFDLPAYALGKLKHAGVSCVYNINRDTCAEEQQFFSYRRCTLRGETYSANNLSVIAIRP